MESQLPMRPAVTLERSHSTRGIAAVLQCQKTGSTLQTERFRDRGGVTPVAVVINPITMLPEGTDCAV